MNKLAQCAPLEGGGTEMGDSDLNHKVYEFAHSQKGQFVGAGRECWDLADSALTYAGAQSSTTTGKNDDYVWGAETGTHQVRAGDILQFRNYETKITTTTRVTFDDGEWSEKTQVNTTKRPHHTAIVATYNPSSVVVLEQNYPEGSRVVESTIPLSSISPTTKTTMKTMKDSSGKSRPATVSVTTTVEVKGQLKAYRPQPKTDTKPKTDAKPKAKK